MKKLKKQENNKNKIKRAAGVKSATFPYVRL
jgi:hypothetical protein